MKSVDNTPLPKEQENALRRFEIACSEPDWEKVTIAKLNQDNIILRKTISTPVDEIDPSKLQAAQATLMQNQGYILTSPIRLKKVISKSAAELAESLGHKRKNPNAEEVTPAELDEMCQLILANKDRLNLDDNQVSTLKGIGFTNEQREAVAAFKSFTEELINSRNAQEDLMNQAASPKKTKELRAKINEDKVKLAKAFRYESKNPGLEPTQKELEEMSQVILKQGLELTKEQTLFLTSTQTTPVKEANIYLADPAGLSTPQVNEINTLLGSEKPQDKYNAAQLMQGKEIDSNKVPNPEELDQANKVMREFQKAVNEVAPIGSKKKDLRTTAKAIGTNLRQERFPDRAAKIVNSLARSIKNALSSKTAMTAASTVRAPKERNQGRGVS